MRTNRHRLVALALVACAPLALAADPGEIALLQRLKRLYPATQWTTVTRTPIGGVYEVVMGTNIAYVGDDARHFLFGHLFDMRTQTDLTAPKLANAPASVDAEPASRVTFALLPLADAIKSVKGNGRRLLAVLSDPNCPYCKLLDDELAKLDNVTVYTFLLPWVNPDRTVALAAWKQAVPQRAGDAGVLDRNLALAARLRLRGTPLLIAGDGRINEGAMRAPDLEAWLGTGDSQARSDVDQHSLETTP